MKEMREQVEKTKQQYLKLIESGKVRDPKKRAQVEETILQLDRQLFEMQAEVRTATNEEMPKTPGPKADSTTLPTLPTPRNRSQVSKMSRDKSGVSKLSNQEKQYLS